MDRPRALVLAALVFAASLVPGLARASTISLTSPLVGSLSPGDVVDLSVSVDPNGVAADNIVAHELYIAFSGLVPVTSSYALGSVYTPFLADLVELNGPCDVLAACNLPLGDPSSPSHYLSLVSVFAPATPTGPGGLFSLRFAAAAGATSWSLDVLGEDGFGLLWDPPAIVCDPLDVLCDPDPAVAPVPFAVVTPGESVTAGIARVDVQAVQTAQPVPEPASLLLIATGLAALAVRRRRAAGR